MSSLATFTIFGAVQVSTNVQAKEAETPSLQSQETPDTQDEQVKRESNEVKIDIGEGTEPVQPEQQEENEKDDGSTDATSGATETPDNHEQTQRPTEQKPSSPTEHSDKQPENTDQQTEIPQQGSAQYRPSQSSIQANNDMGGASATSQLNGSFKYNPLNNKLLQQSAHSGDMNQQVIQRLTQKKNFRDNQFLNQLQQDTDYFRFQAFNPLSTRAYYKNLDKQVLGLIAGEVGTMPDLKKKADKGIASRQQEDKEQQIEQEQTHMTIGQVQQDKEKVRSKTSIHKWLICGFVVLLLAGVLYRLVNRRKE
ncbi:SdrH family protein [Staphylococcus americanisciuri]|nr:SdrH family protein [Staphylococcus americanisciuri]